MDPYEREQERIRALFDQCSESEEEDELGFSDDSVEDLDYSESDFENDGRSSNQTSSDVEEPNAVEHQESEEMDIEWTKSVEPITKFAFESETSGCQLNQLNLSAGCTPRDVFDKIFSQDIVQLLLDSTNKYGEDLSTTASGKTRHSRIQSFSKTDIQEIHTFFGLCLLQGQIKVPRIRHLFSTKSLYYDPIFSSTMSGRRFEQLLRCLNVNPNSGQKHMKKVNSILEIFISNCQLYYKPGPNLSLDESLLLFRGRLANKKSKYGIKFYKLCDPDGYILNLEIYSDKQMQNQVY